MPAQYGDADYWDQRYAAEPTLFDWYITFAGLAPVLTRHVAQDARILQLGVGTSALQAQMVEQGGYQQVLSIDISRVAIKHMQQLHAKLPQLKYRVGDARHMPQYADGAFDALLDKGTLDSLLCSACAAASAADMLDECFRVLRDGGVMLNVTYGEPASRVPLFRKHGWRVEFYVLSKPQQPVAGAPAGAVAGSCVVQGPLDPDAKASLEPFSDLTEAYFAYVCSKPPAAAADGSGGGSGGGGSSGAAV